LEFLNLHPGSGGDELMGGRKLLPFDQVPGVPSALSSSFNTIVPHSRHSGLIFIFAMIAF
jgi:hypothetical protein